MDSDKNLIMAQIFYKKIEEQLIKYENLSQNEDLFTEKGVKKNEDKIQFPFKRFNIRETGASLKIIKKRFENLKNRKGNNIDLIMKKPVLRPELNLTKKDIDYEPLKWDDNEFKQIKIKKMYSDNEPIDEPILESEYYELNLISDYFHELQRLKCNRNGYISPWDYFNNKENREEIKKEYIKILKNYLDKGKKEYLKQNYLYLYRELCYKIFNGSKKELAKAKTCTQFRPSLMVDIINFLFTGDKNIKVLDFSAGWGDRLIAALSFSEKDLKYVGFDPNSNLTTGYESMKKTLLEDQYDKYKDNYQIRNEPFEKATFLDDDNNSFDLVFTSPPYFKLEIYCQEDDQCVKNFDTEDAWLNGFMFKSIENINKLLKNKGFMVLIIQNYGSKGKKTTYIEEIHKYVKKVYPKFKYKGLISYNGGGNISQPMWIWQKDSEYIQKDESEIKLEQKDILDEYSENNFEIEYIDKIPEIKDEEKQLVTFLNFPLNECDINVSDIKEPGEDYKLDNAKFYKLLEDINFKQELVHKQKSKKEQEIYDDVVLKYDVFRSKKKQLQININGQYVTNAWLKIYELINYYKLLDHTIVQQKIKHFDNCAFPGSFILSVNHYVKTNPDFLKHEYEWKASSWLDGDGSYEALKDQYGLLGNYYDKWLMNDEYDGNVVSEKNQLFWKEHFRNKDGTDGTIDLYTSDVGFDKITSYKNKEIDHLPLNIGQILAALLTLKEGGSMVVKQYTFFESLNISLYAILKNVFKEIYITKPITSRPTNTETYVIGKGYYGYNKSEKYIKILLEKIKKFEDNYEEEKTIPLLQKDLLQPGFLTSIYKSANEIYKRHIYYLYNRYSIFEKFKGDLNFKIVRNKVIKHLKQWQNKIYNNWLLDNKIPILNKDDMLNVLDKRINTVNYLQLGDILDITTDNGENGIFIIKFINNYKLILKNDDGDKEYKIENKKIFGIKSIRLLSRIKRNIKGFAQQNKLELNTRIKIEFKDGKEIYGIIQDKRNDGITVEIEDLTKESDKNFLIHIDFKYQGLPDNIEKIIIYENKLKEVHTGTEEFMELMEKSELSKVYTLREQINDLYDNIISSVGDTNFKVIQNVNTQVQRFTHLLEEYAEETNGLIKLKPIKINNIPLIENIYPKYKTKIKWLKPTVTLRKNVACASSNSQDLYNDIYVEEDQPFIDTKRAQNKQEKNNVHSYLYDKKMYIKLNEIHKNHGPINEDIEAIDAFELKIGVDTETIVKNDDEFLSTTITDPDKSNIGYTKTKFSRQKFITSLLPPNPPISPNSLSSPPQINLDDLNEKMYVNGFITTSYDLFKYSRIYSNNINLFTKSILSSININNYILQPSKKNYDNTQECDNDTQIIEKDKIYEDGNNNIINSNFCSYAYLKENYIKDDKDEGDFIRDIIPSLENSVYIALKLEYQKNRNEFINNVSTHRLIQNLSPFLINEYNLTKETKSLLISKYLNTFIDKFNLKLNKLIKNIEKYNTTFLKYNEGDDIKINNLTLQLIKKTYNNNEKLKNSTELENLQYMLNCDQGNLYRTALKMEENNKLIPNIEILTGKINNYYRDLYERKNSELKENDCNIKNTIAKHYFDEDEIEKDNNIDIYYDEKYDDTPYYLLNNDLIQRSDDKKNVLINILKNHYNQEKSKEEIANIADDIILRKKLIRETDVAFMLYIDTLQKKYYIRRENKWEIFDGNQEDFECHLKTPTNCISIKNKCNSVGMNKLQIEESFLNETKNKFIEEVFDLKQIDSDNYQKYYIKNYINEIIIELLENENSRNEYEMAILFEKNSQPISPHTDVLNIILSQNEVDKKYKNIKIFKETYCRNSYDGENDHFYYCKETNKPLMPKFYYDLANSFLDDNMYELKYKTICKKYGIIDGNYVIDKKSGYIIENIEYEKVVEYDDENRVIKTNSIIEDLIIEEKITDLKFLIENYVINLNIALQLDEINNHLIVDLINDILEKEDKLIYKVMFYTTIAVYFIVLQCLLNEKSKIKTYKACPMRLLIVGYPINIIEKSKDNETGINTICCFIREFFNGNKTLYSKNIITKQEYKNARKDKAKFKLDQEFKKEVRKNLRNSIKINLQYYIEKILLNSKIQKFIKENKKKPLSMNLRDELSDIKEEKWDFFLPTLKYFDKQGIRPNIFKINGKNKSLYYQILNKFINTPGDKLRIKIDKNQCDESCKKEVINMLNKNINPLDLIKVEQKYITLKFLSVINYLINFNNIELLLLQKNNPVLENSCCNSKIINIIDYINENNRFNPKTINIIFKQLDNKSIFYQDLIDHYFIKNTQLITKNNTRFKYNDSHSNSSVLNGDFSENTMLEYILKYSKIDEIYKNFKNKKIKYDDKIEHVRQYLTSDASPIDINTEFNKILYEKSNNNGEYYSDNDNFNLIQKLKEEEKTYISIFKQIEDKIKNVQNNKPIDNMNLVQILILYLNQPNETDLKNISDYVRKRIIKINDLLKNNYGLSESDIIPYINSIDDFEKIGEGLYISRDIETYCYKNQFLKRCCLDFAKIYPQLVVKSIDFKKEEQTGNFKLYKSYVEHWNLAEMQYKNIEEEYVNRELYNLIKDNMDGDLENNIPKIELNSMLYKEGGHLHIIYNIVNLLPILSNNENMYLLSKIYKLFFMVIVLIYFDCDIKKEYNFTEKLLKRFFNTINGTKNILNISDITLRNNIQKLKEDEKKDITDKFRGMRPEQRRVENLFKEHKLEHWNLGQTKNLFKYDKNVHQKHLMEMKRQIFLEKKLLDLETDGESKDEVMAEISQNIDKKQNSMNETNEMRKLMESITKGVNKAEKNHEEMHEDMTFNEITEGIRNEEMSSIFDIGESA